jgi:hypothetical protein
VTAKNEQRFRDSANREKRLEKRDLLFHWLRQIRLNVRLQLRFLASLGLTADVATACRTWPLVRQRTSHHQGVDGAPRPFCSLFFFQLFHPLVANHTHVFIQGP